MGDRIEQLFSSPFSRGVQLFHRQLPSWAISPIPLFPLTEIITEGDAFFKRVWQLIDQSKDYFWLTTYAIDSSPAADTTLLKMIEARKRGVNVVLMVDDIQGWGKSELFDRLSNCGGKVFRLNQQFQDRPFHKILTQQFWRRHHEKLIVTDNKSIIGSSNIEGNYAGIRYGNCQFQDLNYYSENIVLEDYRRHFLNVAHLYHYNLDVNLQNEELAARFDRKYPSSRFYPKDKYRVLRNSINEDVREIEESVLGMLRRAEKTVHIIQPYYYPMKRFEVAISEAVRRGVKSVILTAGQREQPAFKKVYNYMYFRRLIHADVQIYQTKERMLHSKVYLSDDQYVNIGSMNNDRWSWQINNELNLEIHDHRDHDLMELYLATMLSKSAEVHNRFQLSVWRKASIVFWNYFVLMAEVLMNKSPVIEDPNLQVEPKDLLEDRLRFLN